MQPSIGKSITRWTRASNRRHLAEELLVAIAWVGVASVIAIAWLRIGELMRAHAWVDAARWPPSTTRWTLAVLVVGVVTGLAGTRALWRYLWRRTRPQDFARALDRLHRTDDLLTTALAIESERVSGDPGLAASVLAHARDRLGSLPIPNPAVREPARTIAGLGVAACLFTWLPTPSQALARHETAANLAPAVASRETTIPPLPERALAALERRASELDALAREPTLARTTQDAIARASQQLEGLRANQERSLSQLAKAERALEELADRALHDRLFDPDALAGLGTDRLLERLTQAIESGDDETASAMAHELRRRLETATPEDMGRVADALEQATREASSASGSSSSQGAAAQGTTPGQGSSSARERWRSGAGERAEQLRTGDPSDLQAELDRMTASTRRRGGPMSDTFDRSLDDVRRARSEQLGRMNGGESPREDGEPSDADDRGNTGKGRPASERAGKEGSPSSGNPGRDGRAGPDDAIAGLPFAPGGRPAPGGGAGNDREGDASTPADGGHERERVEASLRGAPNGTVRLIQRASEGYRDGAEYRELHDQYNAVAEDAIRQEQIPLTRRDYIRRYFEAVRGP